MAYEVIDTRDHPNSRRQEVFPAEPQALEFISRKGWSDVPGILVREVSHENYYNVIQKSDGRRKERRVKKNISKEEAERYAQRQRDLKVEVNTVGNALKPFTSD